MNALSIKIAKKIAEKFGKQSDVLAVPDQANQLLNIAVLAIVYYLSARWSLFLAFEGSNASPVWPPSGIALGAMLLLGRRVWPAITIGTFAANMVAFSAHHVIGLNAVNVSLCIAIGNTLEALTGFYLLRYLKIIDNLLEQPQNVFKFMMVALLMCMVSAVVGTASLILGGTAPMAAKWPIWINWWLGDVGGVLIITPVILTCLNPRAYQTKFPFKVVAYMAASLVGFAVLAVLIFSGNFSADHTDRLLLYVFIPGLAWMAYVFGPRGVSLTSLLLASIAVWGTAHGSGPFATGDLNNSLILLISFIALCCVTGLVLAADLTQRAHSQKQPVVMARNVITPWLTLLAGLAVTILTWHMISSATENAARSRFKVMVADMTLEIREHMAAYEQILRGGVAMFAVSQEVTRDEWHTYAQQLEIWKRFPGIQSIAFADWVVEAKKDAHIRQVKAEGFPDYTVWPAGKREAYVPVNYIEPFDWRNQRAFGYDMFSEPARHEAISRARDTGKTTISGKIRLVQENGQNEQAGFVMFAPVYRNGAFLSTDAERSAALLGFVCSGFRMNDLMDGILGKQLPLIGLEIFDGGQIDNTAKMYTSTPMQRLDSQSMQHAYVVAVPVEIGDHLWTLRMSAQPAFEAAIDRQKAQIILIAGILISLLLFILVRSLAIMRESALALADQMTTALRESETKLRSLNSRMELAAEAGGIGVWDWDLTENTLVWDERMYQMYQIPPDSANNTYAMWREHVHPDDLERIEGALKEALAGGKPYAVEFRIMLRDGQIRRLKANALIVRDEAGQPRHMIGINLDVTDIRQTEESLQASEKRFRGILEHAPIGMALVSLDGHWLDLNDAICDLIGYSKEELRQLTFQDVTHPEDLEQDLDYIRQLLDGSIRSYQMEKRYIRKDRQIVWVLLTVTLMRDEHNAPMYFISQIEDITQRRLSESRLQDTLALKSAMLSSSNLSIIATNTDGVIVSFNQAAQRMLQYEEEEVVGQCTLMILHDADEVAKRAARLSQQLNHPIEPGFDVLAAKPQEGQVDEREWIYIRKDGTRFPVLLSVTAIRDRAGNITGFLAIASNIADRKQKERAIAAALAEKEVLLKEVYHRVKNNLQVITSLFNLQLRTLPEGAARVALKESADRVHVMALVHEKLYRSTDLSSIELDEYIRDLCQQLGSAAGAVQRGITLVTEVEPVQIGLETAVPLGLLLNELISNSLKHGFPDGQPGVITVRLARMGEDKVVLEVADNGVGFPAGLDVHASRSLGLKLVAMLSDQLRGEFVMESRNGAYASLIFRLNS
jgi:PAS domain S-box-containing protein